MVQLQCLASNVGDEEDQIDLENQRSRNWYDIQRISKNCFILSYHKPAADSIVTCYLSSSSFQWLYPMMFQNQEICGLIKLRHVFHFIL